MRSAGGARRMRAPSSMRQSTCLDEQSTVRKPFGESLLDEGNESFVRTVTEKLLTYSLGRGLDYRDAPTVRRITGELARNDYRWSALVLGIVTSDPFQMRRAAGPETTAPAAVAGP